MQEITRLGIITQITTKDIYVKIQQQTACATCSHKASCTTLSCQEKVIKLPRPKNLTKKVGEEIHLHLTNYQSYIAILLGFILPLLIIVLSLIISLKSFAQTENYSAIITLCLLGTYYLLLAFFKHKLNNFFRIKISQE